MSFQWYPSEYAYRKASVSTSERISANCKMYPSGLVATHHFRQDYIHCNGTQLQLTDSDFGSEQFNSADYYEWPMTSKSSQLLFIFPIRVNLTSITIHYYSDRNRGLPRLKFYAVSDQFDIWTALTASDTSTYVEVTEVPPNEQSAGRRSMNVNVTFSTRKVLMHRFGSDFKLAVNEVEFFSSYSKVAGNGIL